MTLQNRVDPWGKLNAVSSRGAWLGNRGILHNEQKEIIAQWRHKSWVTCKLQFRGTKRDVFSQGSYSELFFFDEATAFSAGHRPCAECRKDRYNEFKTFWCSANRNSSKPSEVKIAEIDNQLHTERAVRGGAKVTFQDRFSSVPDGAFIELNGEALLIWEGNLYLWSAQGYKLANIKIEPFTLVTVITPASIVRMFSNGFRPEVHESASC